MHHLLEKKTFSLTAAHISLEDRFEMGSTSLFELRRPANRGGVVYKAREKPHDAMVVGMSWMDATFLRIEKEWPISTEFGKLQFKY